MEHGNTKVLAVVRGPRELASSRGSPKHDRVRRLGWQRRGGGSIGLQAVVTCEVRTAAFSAVERRRGGKGDRRGAETELMLARTFEQVGCLADGDPGTAMDADARSSGHRH